MRIKRWEYTGTPHSNSPPQRGRDKRGAAESPPPLCRRARVGGLRPAFTLIELVIVIAIIAILAALTTGVAMRFYGIQQQRNTEVTITKVSQVLERQWQAVIDKARTEKLPPDGPPFGDPRYFYSMRGVYEQQILPMAAG